MLIWLENAPQFGIDSDAKVTSFIDGIITCQKPVDINELLKMITTQFHRHSHTCCKNTKSICRFNHPQPPMRQTQILYPLDTNATEIKKPKIHGNQDNFT